MDFCEIFGKVGRGPRTNRLDFGIDSDHDYNSGFLELDHYLDHGIFKMIFDKIFRGVGRGPRNNRLDFGGDLDYDTDTGTFFMDSLFTIL